MTQTKKTKPKKDSAQEKQIPIAPNTILTITIPADEAAKAYDKVLNKLKNKVVVAGFRKGQAPTKLAEEKIGAAEIIDQALQMLVPDKYSEAIKAEKKEPLAHPEFKPLKLDKGGDWVLEAHIAESPQIELKGYVAVIKAAKKEAAAHLAEQAKERREAAKKAAKQDSGSKDGKEDKSAPQVAAEPTEEQTKDHELHHIYQGLIEKHGPAIPELLIKEEVRYDLDQLARRLESMNFSIETFLQQRGMTFEQLSSQLAVEAIGRLQLTFILNAIAQKEGIEVDEKDVDEQINKIEDEKIRGEQMKSEQYRALVRQTLKRQKVVDFLIKL